MSLKGIPTWVKLGGALGVVVLAILIYEYRKAKENEPEQGDPCDPESDGYNLEECERLASGDTSQYPPQVSGAIPGTGAGGGGGIIYPYLPAGATDVPAPAPETETPEPNPEPVPTTPTEPVHTLPPPVEGGSIKAPSAPAPVPGSRPDAGLETNTPVFVPVTGIGAAVPLPPAAVPPTPIHHGPGGQITGLDNAHGFPQHPTGGSGGTGAANPQPVRNDQPVASENHPAAVDTGNKCVKGGVGGHTPPSGWHLYCGGNGNIWRAPN